MQLTEAYKELCDRESLTPDTHQLRAIAEIEEFTDSTITQSRRRKLKPKACGLYIWGSVGRGKTMLMDLMYDNVHLQKRRIHFHALMREIRDRLSQTKGVNPMRRVTTEIAPPGSLLCIDEVHVSDLDTGMVLELFLKELIKNRLVVVSTSNFSPDDLFPEPSGSFFGLGSGQLLEASKRETIRLLADHFRILKLEGDQDYRYQTNSGSSGRGLYLRSDQAHETLEAIFDTRIGDDEELEPCFTVFGRPVSSVRRAANAIWFNYADICEDTFSYRDYLEILNGIRFLVLVDVQITSFDGATRFSWLVEIAYDAGIELIVSSDVPPKELFEALTGVPKHLQLEHERVTSRVSELSSSW